MAIGDRAVWTVMKSQNVRPKIQLARGKQSRRFCCASFICCGAVLPVGVRLDGYCRTGPLALAPDPSLSRDILGLQAMQNLEQPREVGPEVGVAFPPCEGVALNR